MIKVKSFSIVEELVVEYCGAEYVISTREERDIYKNMAFDQETFEDLKKTRNDLHLKLSAIFHLKCRFKQEKLL